MGCAASSSLSTEDAANGKRSQSTKKYVIRSDSGSGDEGGGDANECGPARVPDSPHKASKTNTSGSHGCDGDRRRRVSSKVSSEGYCWKWQGTIPLMSALERQEMVSIYSLTFRTARQVLATIGRIKSTMKRWIQAARQRLREQKEQRLLEEAVRGVTVTTGVDDGRPSTETSTEANQTKDRGAHCATSASDEKQQHNISSQPGDEDAFELLTFSSAAPLFPLFLNDTLHVDSDGNACSPPVHHNANNTSENADDTLHNNTNAAAIRRSNSVIADDTRSILSRKQSRQEHISNGEKLIAQRLEHLRLTQISMLDDGNCQFRALAHQILGDVDRHGEVRSVICKAMRAKKEDEYDFLFESPQDCQDYLDLMSEEGTFGDELSLRAACDIYGIVVHMITSEQEQYYVRYVPNMAAVDPDEYFDLLDVFLAVVEPVHFNSVTLKKPLSQAKDERGT
jgi:hypothetical protein